MSDYPVVGIWLIVC